MIEYTNEQLEQAIAALPEEFQEAIASSFVSEKALEIGKRHNLHIDQLGKMKDITMLALLNLVDTSRFSETLAEELSVSQEEANSLVRDVDAEIFDGLRKLIREETTEKENDTENLLKDEEKPEEETPAGTTPAQEEVLNREEVLRGIENLAPAIPPQLSAAELAAPKPPVIAPATPAAAPKTPEVIPPATVPTQAGSIPEQKLAAPFNIPATETKKEESSIASIKKMDPYRETV